jgi:hypothetical protein
VADTERRWEKRRRGAEEDTKTETLGGWDVVREAGKRGRHTERRRVDLVVGILHLAFNHLSCIHPHQAGGQASK